MTPEKLLAQMTLAEKIGQMTQLTIERVSKRTGPFELTEPQEFDEADLHEAIVERGVGSILNVGIEAHSPEWWRGAIGQIQQLATQSSRLKIPVLYGIDSIHGANYVRGATLFPQPLGVASSFNLPLAEELAALAAYETRAAGIPWNFSPAMDVGRQPLWPRLWESFGEDGYVNGLFAAATIRGYQGDDASHPERVAACAKHYVGYGAPRSGKDRTPAPLTERELREHYLPAFRMALEAGAPSVMVNSGTVDGVPVHASKWLLTDVLRDELGFDGVVVTDWLDIKYLHDRHYVAPTMKEAVRMSVEAGIDMSMVPDDYSFPDLLLELVEEGTISEERIDRSVLRILKLKEKVGLFERPTAGDRSYPNFNGDDHRRTALRAAEESMILLKNDHELLPLPKKPRILLCGPGAATMQSLNGGWTYTWQGDRTDRISPHRTTIRRALEAEVGAKNVKYVPGCTFTEAGDYAAVTKAAKFCDVAVVCLGEDAYCEQFGNLHDLELPEPQRRLVHHLATTELPVVLVLTQGRPRLIREVEPYVESILCSFFPGNEGGNAVVRTLFGKSNPSGKLPLTYPKHPNSLVPYDHVRAEEQDLNGFTDWFDPQYEFGFGMSYTSFAYSDISIEKTELHEDDTLEISVTITNTGKRAGAETVLLFVSDLYASIVPPNKRLRGFQKVFLQPGKQETVRFSIAITQLAFVDRSMKNCIEPGAFRATLGESTAKFSVTKTRADPPVP